MKNISLYHFIVCRAYEKGYVGEEEDVFQQIIEEYRSLTSEIEKTLFATTIAGKYHLNKFLTFVNEIEEFPEKEREVSTSTSNEKKKQIDNFIDALNNLPETLDLRDLFEGNGENNVALPLDIKEFVRSAVESRFN